MLLESTQFDPIRFCFVLFCFFFSRRRCFLVVFCSLLFFRKKNFNDLTVVAFPGRQQFFSTTYVKKRDFDHDDFTILRMLRFFFITWSTFLTGYLNMTHRYSPTCTNGNQYRVKFPSDCISLCNKPDDISITASCGVILRERYERNWPSDVHIWPHKCKQVTELYLLKTTKRVIKKCRISLYVKHRFY